MKKFIGFLRLTRPANIVTAIADILAGIAIAGYFSSNQLDEAVWLLILSTVGLYGGGVVMNDFFDADIDASERPERPIPSGLISRTEALTFGIALLAVGVVAAFLQSSLSGSIALAIALAATLYDKWAKHHRVLGPLVMGLCRGLNLLLGMSIVPYALSEYWFFGFVPMIYVGAITMISAGEVHGGKRGTLNVAGALYILSMVCIVAYSIMNRHLAATFILVLLWGFWVFTPLREAAKVPEGRFIGRAVKAGVLALILMDGAWAAAAGQTSAAIAIVLLLPVSFLLARIFAVT